jgi:Zn-dependent protease
MEQLDLIQKLAVWVVPALLAITVHEVAHGWMALKLGDRTAMMLGRLTLNPIKHIDPIGTLLVPGLLLAIGGFIFGWAKPVPVTWENLRHPKRDMALVALAGPMANLLMAAFWLVLMQIGMALMDGNATIAQPLIYMAVAGIFINAILMILNLLPLPPLDGSRVVASLLPGPLAWQYSRLEPYGLIILLVLFVTQILGKIMWPLLAAFFGLLFTFSDVTPGFFQTVLRVII